MLIELGVLYMFRILAELRNNQNCERGENEEDKFYIVFVNSDVSRHSLCL